MGFLSILICSVWSAVYPKLRLYAFAFVTLAFVLAFSAMNSGKYVESDWLWYNQHYQMTGSYRFLDYLGSKIGAIEVKYNEPVYYFLSRIVYFASGGNSTSLAYFVTFVDYGCMAVSIYIIVSKYEKDNNFSFNVIMLVSFVILSITFTLVAHLVRQEMAASFLALSYAFLVRGNRKSSFIFLVLSVLTHQTAFIFAGTLFAPYYIAKFAGRNRSLRWSLLFIAVLTSFIIGYLIANSDLSSLGMKNDGAVSGFVFAFDLIIFAALSIVVLSKRGGDLGLFTVKSYLIFYSAFAALYTVPLAALRIYFYIDLLRTFGVIVIASIFLRKLDSIVLRGFFSLLMFVLAVLYNEIRIYSSPFYFKASLSEYLLYIPYMSDTF